MCKVHKCARLNIHATLINVVVCMCTFRFLTSQFVLYVVKYCSIVCVHRIVANTCVWVSNTQIDVHVCLLRIWVVTSLCWAQQSWEISNALYVCMRSSTQTFIFFIPLHQCGVLQWYISLTSVFGDWSYCYRNIRGIDPLENLCFETCIHCMHMYTVLKSIIYINST